MGKARKSEAGASYKNGSVAELLKELWNAAVALRGHIEPADYKRYVLPLIFLRFLSLRFEKRHAELVAAIADPKSDLHTTDKQLALDILNDADHYTARQTFLVPEAARWESIVKIARADDIRLRLDNILALLEKTFPKLKGLLPPIYANSNLDKESIAGLINLFSKDIFRFEAGGVDMLGRVYEYFIGEFANSEGKRGGEYFTPASIVQTLVAMLEPVEGKVFDPCCGSGGMFVQSRASQGHHRPRTRRHGGVRDGHRRTLQQRNRPARRPQGACRGRLRGLCGHAHRPVVCQHTDSLRPLVLEQESRRRTQISST